VGVIFRLSSMEWWGLGNAGDEGKRVGPKQIRIWGSEKRPV
jgi:hypothetical protein